MLAHLYMHDYFFHVSVTDKLTGSLSLAAAVSASLLLASRLREPRQVVWDPPSSP
jgi:Phosphatidylinositol N-acetylglucosaminyltransferase